MKPCSIYNPTMIACAETYREPRHLHFDDANEPDGIRTVLHCWMEAWESVPWEQRRHMEERVRKIYKRRFWTGSKKRV